MRKYRVTIYFSEIYEVDAENEENAKEKADKKLGNLNVIPLPDDYEVECLDEE